MGRTRRWWPAWTWIRTWPTTWTGTSPSGTGEGRAAWPALATALAVLLLDQALKGALLAGWVPPARLDPGLAVVVSLNPGAAGGLLTGWGPLLGAASLVGAGVLLVLGSSPTSPRHGLAVGLVAGGALANGLDRLRLGGVVDWLVLGDRLALNLADLALVVGVLLGVAAGWPGGTTRRERRG
ncbi:MAG: signal peptidase II [Limnochorda sp.]